MSEDLGGRLVRAGLCTAEQIEEANALRPAGGGALVRELVRLGVSQDLLAGFFIAEGYGPLIQASELVAASAELRAKLPLEMAEALFAWPVRLGGSGLVVAMADPSDSHALDEVGYGVRERVCPAVGRVMDLCALFDRQPRPKRRTGPIELVRLRPSELPSGEEGRDAVPVPLVRQKSTLPPAILSDRWDERPRGRPSTAPRTPSSPPGDLGAFLVELRTFVDPAQMLAQCCHAARLLGRASVFLVERRRALEARAASGPMLTARTLEGFRISLTAPSVFATVIDTQARHVGEHGATEADVSFRQAIGSIGGTLLCEPVFVGGRTVGILCVDDLRYGPAGFSRAQAIAEAAGEGLRRMISGRTDKHR